MTAYEQFLSDAAKHSEVMCWIADYFAPAVARAAEEADAKLGEEPPVTGWRAGAFLRIRDLVAKIGRAGRTAGYIAKEAAK